MFKESIDEVCKNFQPAYRKYESKERKRHDVYSRRVESWEGGLCQGRGEGVAGIHGQTETDRSHKSPGSVQYKSKGSNVDATGGHKYDLAGRDLQQLIENYFPAIVTARSRRSFASPRLIFPRVTREEGEGTKPN